MENLTPTAQKAKVIDFQQFKNKQEQVTPAPSLPGKKSSPKRPEASKKAKSKEDPAWNFNQRLAKIRGSLDRIHTLMSELRGLQSDKTKRPKK